MAEIKSISRQSFTLHFVMTEDEAGALHDIAAYGTDAFLGVFKEKLGKHYIQKHEKGLISLFESIRAELPKHFSRFDEARKVFDNTPKP